MVSTVRGGPDAEPCSPGVYTVAVPSGCSDDFQTASGLPLDVHLATSAKSPGGLGSPRPEAARRGPLTVAGDAQGSDQSPSVSVAFAVSEPPEVIPIRASLGASQQGLSPGPHTVVMQAHLRGSTEIRETPPLEIELAVRLLAAR